MPSFFQRRFLSFFIFLFTFLLGFFLFPKTNQAIATDYYVATNGNDSNSGTSINSPWRTIQKAANTLVAGDTVYIRAGTYNEQVIPQNSGSSTGGYISYTAYAGETVTIDGSGLSFGTWDGLFWIDGKSYIQVSGLRVINALGGRAVTGIRVDSSDHIIVAGNYTYNTESSGIGVWGSNNVVVDGNEIERANNGGSNENLSIDTSDQVEVMNNHVHQGIDSGQGGEGINVKNGSSNVRVYNNVVRDNPRLAFGLDAWTRHTYNIEYFGNVAYNCAHGLIVSSEQGGLAENIKVYNNIAYNNQRSGLFIPHWGGTTDGLKRNIYFVNNTSFNNGYGMRVQAANNENVVIRNNILSQNGTNILVESGAVAETTVDHNLCYGAGGCGGSDTVIGDPLFVNPSAADFHLQSNSPAINAGSSLNAPNTDFDGNFRPQGAGYDIGAYEYGGVIPSPFPSPTPTPPLSPPPTPTPTPSSAPVQLPLRVNSAGEGYTDTRGYLWRADQSYSSGSWGYLGGNTLNRWDENPNLDIGGTEDDYLYVTERYALTSYQVDLSSDTYDIVLHFAETFSGITGPGQRIFDVSIEGQTVLDNFDPYAEAGHSRAIIKPISPLSPLSRILRLTPLKSCLLAVFKSFPQVGMR
jgi:hypothetical protein